MRSAYAHQKRFGPRTSVLLAIVGSALGHGLFGVVADKTLRVPDLGIELSIPIDVELGLSDPVVAEAVPPPAPIPSAPATPSDAPKNRAPGADAGPADAGISDGGAAHSEVADASTTPAAADAGTPRLPPGAQIAVRVDMARIRTSAVAEDVRGLLAAIPDWRVLLEGSGIDPVTQLDRLLIATPNLSREKVVVAGRFVGDVSVVEHAVSEMASNHGVAAEWTRSFGVATAPWASSDPTPRVLAVVGPQHFVIARPEDLPRILAIASARSAGKKGKNAQASHPAEALLSMDPGEGLSLEVEGVSQFVRKGRQGIPRRLRLSATELPQERVALHAHLTFADEVEAKAAQVFWDQARTAYARNPLVALLGLGGPLTSAKLSHKDDTLDADLILDIDQTRLILGYAREFLTPAASPKPAPAPAPSP